MQRALILAIGFILLLNPFYSKAQDSTNADAFFNSGMLAFKKLDFSGAIIDFTEVIKYRRTTSDPYYYRGYAEMMGNLYPEAVGDFDTALTINPKDGPSMYERGMTYNRWGKYKLAISDFNTYEIMSSGNAYGYEGLGFAYLQQKEYDSALYFLNKGMKTDSSNVEMYFYRGIANYKLKNYRRCIPDFKLFLRINPNHSETLSYMMDAEYILKDDSATLFYADRYLIMNKEDSKAYFLRGQSYFRMMRYSDASANFTEVINRKADLPDAFYYRGICDEKLGFDEKACSDFKRAAILGNTKAVTLVKNFCQ